MSCIPNGPGSLQSLKTFVYTNLMSNCGETTCIKTKDV